MIPRQIEHKLHHLLQNTPVVALLGARQVGKTTLSLSLASNQTRPTLYLDLERPSDIAKLHDAEYFLSINADKLIILDEIQRMPHILPIIRSLIDERRRKGDRCCQYLLLGSSSNILLKNTSDSLAGRISYLEIGGFTAQEIHDTNSLWCKGGFPDSYLASSDEASFQWRTNLIRTYIEREMPILGYQVSSQIMSRFWGMLAHNHGQLFNASKIAASLGVSSPTVSRYLDILADLFMVRIVHPWSENYGKRLVKTPKIYIKDTGLLHCLLNLRNINDILSHPICGTSWEGFVIENIANILEHKAQISFYRTAAGAEMDLVIEHGSQRIGIEVKRSLAPTLNKGLHNSMQDLKLERVYVVYPGKEEYQLNEQICVTPIQKLMEKLVEKLQA